MITGKTATWLAGGVVAAAGLAYFHALLANPAVDGCQLFRVESHPAYAFTESAAQDELRSWRDRFCKRVEEGKSTLDTTTLWLDAVVTVRGFCRSFGPNPALTEAINKRPGKDAIIAAHKKFCDVDRIRFPQLVARVQWLRTEYFCQTTRYTVDPGGWMGVFKPAAPSWKRLEDLSYSLCNELRKGALTLDEAYYRWSQELLWTRTHIGGEIAQDAAKPLLELLDGASALLLKLLRK